MSLYYAKVNNYSCYFGKDHHGYGENFMGNEGTIEVLNRQTLHFYPEKFVRKPPAASGPQGNPYRTAGERQQGRGSAYAQLGGCH